MLQSMGRKELDMTVSEQIVPQIEWASRICEGAVFPLQKELLMFYLFNSCYFDINTHCSYSEIF